LQQCVKMGLDLMDVKDFIDEGIPEANIELVLDHSGKGTYTNPLKPAGERPKAKLQYDFEYYNPEE